MPSRPALAIHVLGQLEVDGVEAGAFGSRKARALLTALALGRGSRVSVDVLTEAVWGQRPPARPADQLAVLVSRLRTALGRDRILYADGGYRLRYDWLDVDALDELVTEAHTRLSAGAFTAAATAARAAISLIRGSLSDDLAGEWVLEEQANLARLVTRARRIAAESVLAVGDWSAASELASRALAEDPYAEDALRVLMRAEVTGGRTGVALAAYAQLRERLGSELGTSPSPATESLHLAILRGELSTREPRTPESSRTTLVGRAGPLAELDVALAGAGAEVPMAWVVGEPGIGKSTLVNAWAEARAAAGVPVVAARCTPLERSFPLGVLTAALARHLRTLDPSLLAGVLGPDHDVVAPLLGFAPTSAHHTLLADSIAGPTLLYEALAGVVERAAGHQRMVLLLDDLHDADRATLEWLAFVSHRPLPLAVVATVRTGQTEHLPAGTTIELGPLGLEDARTLVGDDRAPALHTRSGGHPLFLVELARAPDDDTLPETLVDAVAARWADLGDRAAATVRSAAVIGPTVDLDLLATVLGRPAIEVLEDLDLARARGLLVEVDGAFRFRHDLVRLALATGASQARTTLTHREAARALARRQGDPSVIAHHARLGEDPELEAAALHAAAVRAAELFDHWTAESLLDRAVEVSADPDLLAERARVRIRIGDYRQALEDARRCLELGGDATDLGAWAAYYLRDFDLARGYADQGTSAPAGSQARARSLVIGGRISHASGDLATAETLLTRAVGESDPREQAVATAWLGTLRSHQSRTAEALQLLRPARASGAQHTPAVMHALLFAGHALAVAGRAHEAIEAFATYEAEVRHRNVDRFRARGANMTGWVLHSLGAIDEAADLHHESVEVGDRQRFPEMQVAAGEDLAEVALWRGDPAEAQRLLEPVARTLDDALEHLVFGWRLRMKLWWLRGRACLDADDREGALGLAQALSDDAGARGVPRYAAVADVLGLRAHRRLGGSDDASQVDAVLDAVDRAIPLETWWLTGQVGADLGLPPVVDRAATRMSALAAAAGSRGDALRTWAAPLLDRWSAEALRRR